MDAAKNTRKAVKSQEMFNQAQLFFPGGVNSPVRAFGSVGGTPLFIRKGKGAEIWDEDGNVYYDFCGSWGPLILGHSPEEVNTAIAEVVERGTSFGAPTREENKLAALILEHLPHVDKLRFVNSGTEAVMSALRLARGFTGKNKVIKFEGCYHGHVDSMLVKAGSGLATLGTSSSAGIPPSYAAETIVLPLNDKAAVEEAFAKYADDIACVIIEPIPANNGLLLQEKEFLNFLRTITSEHGALLFFDEVISGFRVCFGGASEYYGITPDLVSYGKIIGGGLPVGAYGGKQEIMDCIAPLGSVYQAGTLSGNPLAMAAGFAQLSQCLTPGFYEKQTEKTQYFVARLNDVLEENQVNAQFVTVGSIFWMAPSQTPIRRSDEIVEGAMDLFNRLFHALLQEGVYVGPSGYEVGFVSAAHSEEILDECVRRFERALRQVL